jgi:uncharacterized membrane protein YczE
VPRLLWGLVVFGAGIGLMIHADIGLGPWDAFHQGITEHTGVPIGTVSIVVGVVVLLGWIPLRQRIGIGTVANTVVVGIVIDLVLWALPDVERLAIRVPELALSLVLSGLGCAAYLSAGLGAGPRDGLMTGLAELGVGSVRAVRTGIELTVLVLGFLLGGSIGIGTVVIAVTIGPIVQWFLERMAMPPLVPTVVAGIEVDAAR